MASISQALTLAKTDLDSFSAEAQDLLSRLQQKEEIQTAKFDDIHERLLTNKETQLRLSKDLEGFENKLTGDVSRELKKIPLVQEPTLEEAPEPSFFSIKQNP